MNLKSLLFILFVGGAALGYTWYPKENPLASYQHCPIELTAEEKQLFAEFMETLKQYCQSNNFQEIEQIFVHNQAAREIAKAESGIDPVIASLELLEEYHEKIKWHDCKFITYQQAPNAYEVIAKTESKKDFIRFSFRRYNQTYYLEEIQAL